MWNSISSQLCSHVFCFSEQTNAFPENLWFRKFLLILLYYYWYFANWSHSGKRRLLGAFDAAFVGQFQVDLTHTAICTLAHDPHLHTWFVLAVLQKIQAGCTRSTVWILAHNYLTLRPGLSSYTGSKRANLAFTLPKIHPDFFRIFSWTSCWISFGICCISKAVLAIAYLHSTHTHLSDPPTRIIQLHSVQESEPCIHSQINWEMISSIVDGGHDAALLMTIWLSINEWS